MPTAAAIIIGDEILSGKFADENGPWLAIRCREIGLDLTRISIISDDIHVIAHEVRTCSSLVDHVFTSGGVGPTHDDMTMAGVAAAFDVPLKRNDELAELVQNRMGKDANEDALRMTDLPQGAELWWDGDLRFPVVAMRNVAIFPGVPKYFRTKWNAVSHRFAGVPIVSRSLTTLQRETAIATTLRKAQADWPSVAIGSYPRFDTDPQNVIICMDGRDTDALDGCEAYLRQQISIID
ncbi:MAG: competence/damage-inducible protein A [Deltaproteobacteria bacterium]|nr:competence/damage-inducible protein A [Deltaproteobacteria bacterium]